MQPQPPSQPEIAQSMDQREPPPPPPPAPKWTPGLMIAYFGSLMTIIGLFLPWETTIGQKGCATFGLGFIVLYPFSPIMVAFALLIPFAARIKAPIVAFTFAILNLDFILLFRAYWHFGFICHVPVEIGGIGVYISLLGAILGIAGSSLEFWRIRVAQK